MAAIKYEVLDASQRIEFKSIYEAINDCFGTEYTGWMKATWPNNFGNGRFRAWFPKLAETKNGQFVSAGFDCVNTISDDWNEVVFDDLKNTQANMDKKYWGYDLIFAKEPKGGLYLFRGVYIRDGKKSRPNHDVVKRIGTRVRVIGSPAYDIEILDDFREKEQAIDINTPMSPAWSEVIEGEKIITCGMCFNRFHKAPRCPECGQSMKY
ncbi:MAG: hypothetical protein KBS96_07275 [Lachnospiraceae bacterium]|nr:hypothetical protein [Candidatus Colinaster scatohippi]